MSEPGLDDEGTRKPDMLRWLAATGIVVTATGILLPTMMGLAEHVFASTDLVTFILFSFFVFLPLFAYVIHRFRALRRDIDPLLARVRSARHEIDVHEVHQSIHHLFSNRDVLRPRGGRYVDMVLDAADLPTGLMAYLQEVKDEGAETRLLILDPSSELLERHRLTMTGDARDSKDVVEHLRAKIRAAIGEIRSLATVRLYDAVPPGNLIIVDDHVFWGGIPAVPTDVSFPIVDLTVDTRERLYWSFRRNFDALWKSAKPVEAQGPSTSSLTAATL